MLAAFPGARYGSSYANWDSGTPDLEEALGLEGSGGVGCPLNFLVSGSPGHLFPSLAHDGVGEGRSQQLQYSNIFRAMLLLVVACLE